MVVENMRVSVPEGTTELVIRSGEAEPIELPEAMEIAGQLDAPARFVEKRKHTIEKDTAHVRVDRRVRKIALEIDERSMRSVSVIGELMVDDDLESFGINTTKTYSPGDLGQFLKLKRQFFADRDKHVKLLGSLRDFKVKMEAAVEQARDDKGNRRTLIDKQVKEMNVELLFSLSVPLFEGGKRQTFAVEICCDVRDGGTTMWLESVELAELMHDQTNALIDEQLERLGDYVIIEQ